MRPSIKVDVKRNARAPNSGETARIYRDSELPYQVSTPACKNRLRRTIANEALPLVADARDESDPRALCIVIVMVPTVSMSMAMAYRGCNDGPGEKLSGQHGTYLGTTMVGPLCKIGQLLTQMADPRTETSKASAIPARQSTRAIHLFGRFTHCFLNLRQLVIAIIHGEDKPKRS